jgi:hypothetical protein
MSRRVVIITEIIAPYRIPVFNALAQYDGIDLHVIFLAESDRTQRQWLVYKEEIRFSYQVLPSWRCRFGRHSLLLNWGAKTALRQAAPDFIVCGGYNYVASWRAMAWARRNRVPFSLWAESTARDFRGGYALIEFLKTRFLRACDAFVVPGKSSVEYLMNYGVPEEMIFTAPNAVDTFAGTPPCIVRRWAYLLAFFSLLAAWYRRKAFWTFSSPIVHCRQTSERKWGSSLSEMVLRDPRFFRVRRLLILDPFRSSISHNAITWPPTTRWQTFSSSPHTRIPGVWW